MEGNREVSAVWIEQLEAGQHILVLEIHLSNMEENGSSANTLDGQMHRPRHCGQ